jgi:hypothetical protein
VGTINNIVLLFKPPKINQSVTLKNRFVMKPTENESASLTNDCYAEIISAWNAKNLQNDKNEILLEFVKCKQCAMQKYSSVWLGTAFYGQELQQYRSKNAPTKLPLAKASAILGMRRLGKI